MAAINLPLERLALPELRTVWSFATVAAVPGTVRRGRSFRKPDRKTSGKSFSPEVRTFIIIPSSSFQSFRSIRSILTWWRREAPWTLGANFVSEVGGTASHDRPPPPPGPPRKFSCHLRSLIRLNCAFQVG